MFCNICFRAGKNTPRQILESLGSLLWRWILTPPPPTRKMAFELWFKREHAYFHSKLPHSLDPQALKLRAVIKRWGPRISPGYFQRKIEPKEIPSCLIPRPLVVFTRQLEILVTALRDAVHMVLWNRYNTAFWSFPMYPALPVNSTGGINWKIVFIILHCTSSYWSSQQTAL